MTTVTELHVLATSAVDVDAMPLITTFPYAERHISSAFNRAQLGLVSPGIYRGFNPTVNASGLILNIEPDAELGYGVGVVNLGTYQIRVLQQHTVNVAVVSGFVNYVVLSAFYDTSTKTSQVDSESSQSPADILVLTEDQVLDSHEVICIVDMTGGGDSILETNITYTGRNSSGLDWETHEKNPNAHPGLQDSVGIVTDAKILDHNNDYASHPALIEQAQENADTSVSTHNNSSSAHPELQEQMGTVGASKVTTHNNDQHAHPLLQTQMGTVSASKVSAHDTSSNAHKTQRAADLVTAKSYVESHNNDDSAHPDLLNDANSSAVSKVSEHNASDSAHPSLKTQMAADTTSKVDSHNNLATAHPSIRAEITSTSNSKVTAHNSSGSAHSDIRSLISSLSGSKIDVSKISNSTTSQSTSNVASSKAVYLLKELIEDTGLDGIEYTDAEISKLMGDTPKATLDTFTEIAAALNDDDDAMAALTTLIGTKIATSKISNSTTSTSTSNVASSKAVKLVNDLAVAAGSPISSSVSYDEDENVSSVTEVFSTGTSVTTFTYDDDVNLIKSVNSLNGKTTTTTFVYNDEGSLTDTITS